MRILPRDNRVLLELNEMPSTFAGGMLLIARVPDGEGYYYHYPRRGTVLEVGPKVRDLEIGDEVICPTFNGVKLSQREFGGRNLMLIRETFVLMKIEGAVDVDFGVDYGDRSPRKDRRSPRKDIR